MKNIHLKEVDSETTNMHILSWLLFKLKLKFYFLDIQVCSWLNVKDLIENYVVYQIQYHVVKNKNTSF